MRHLRPAVAAVLGVLVTACDGQFSFVPEGFEDIAAKATDISTYLARQRSDQVAFGNAEFGTASNNSQTLGRIGVRLTATGSGSPSITGVPIQVGDARASALPVTTGTSIAVIGEGSLRVYRGFSTGESRALSVDLVGRAFLVSGLPSNALHVDGGSVGGAIGSRIGILSDRGRTPAISVLLMQGQLPGVSFESDPEPVEGGGTAAVSNQMKLTSTTARITLSKQFGALGVTGGYGVDVVTVKGTAVGTITGRSLLTESATVGMETDLRRTNLFGGFTYRTGGVTLGGEIGRTTGGKGPDELNTFASGGGSRVYASVGVRTGY